MTNNDQVTGDRIRFASLDSDDLLTVKDARVIPADGFTGQTHAMVITYQTEDAMTQLALCLLTRMVSWEHMPKLGPNDIMFKDEANCLKCLEWIRS